MTSARSERALPRHALLLRDFVNTLDIDDGTDELRDPASLVTWLDGRGLIPAGTGDSAGRRAGDADLDAAVALRESLRAAMRAHHDMPEPPSGIEAAAAGLPLRISESDGVPTLVPVETGVRGGLAWLAAAIAASTADHSWERLKICAEDTCQWAFLDSSKNRSKHWCSMQECGNRAKTRAYRARRAARASAG
jgi:predicted RNA-binding Zn ribbon-like protein